MSPDIEMELRERYPDLLVADTDIAIGDGWADIVDTMLEKIRSVVGDGRIKLLRLYSVDGKFRVDVRSAQLDRRIDMRVNSQILLARWHTHRTPENPENG
jgi:hypothetical protein